MAFQEFSAEFTNFANALDPGAKHVLDQASRVKGVIGIHLDLRDHPHGGRTGRGTRWRSVPPALQ
eukprot:12549631-Heterocapsa_arctica.AAC.1